MNLPFKLPFGKKERKDYFLALLLHDERVSAAIFEESSGKIRVVGEHEEYFADSIESLPEEELLEAIDKAISEAESSLPKNIQTQKTIFGLKGNWIEDAKIKKTYLIKLKKISDALDLSPLGFLIIHEAVAHLIQQEEGVPLSAIIVEVSTKNITASLLRAGRIVETKITNKEESEVITTDKLLHHFANQEVLPSRIVLLNEENPEKLAQEFTGHTWSKNLPFLHVPRITTLSKGFNAKAVIFGAAKEMGFEILNIEKGSEKTNVNENEENKSLRIKEEKEIEKDSSNDDVCQKEMFGFVKEEDIALLAKKIEKPQEVNNTVLNEPDNITRTVDKFPKLNMDKMIFVLKKILLLAIGFVAKINLKPPKLPRLIFVPPLIITLFMLLLVFYIFGVKATIILSVKPKIIEKEKTILFSTNDKEQKDIFLKATAVSEEGTITIPTSGKKEIGEKAKGTVTIYSRLTEEAVLKVGTTIISSNDLVFTLDASANLSSSSADASSPPTTAKVNVTAKNIGKESNLPSGTKFTIASFPASSIIAKNEGAFSGGNKKEINVVAKEDLDKAALALISKLEPNAKNKIAEKITEGFSILPFFIDTTLEKKESTKDIGEEGGSVTLKSKVNYQGASYKKNDLDTLAKTLLKDETEGTNLENVSYDLREVKKNKDLISANLFIKASLLPPFDNQKLAQQIAGKSFYDSKLILSKLPQVKKIEIETFPKIPLLPKILPRTPKNITFVVKNNE